MEPTKEIPKRKIIFYLLGLIIFPLGIYLSVHFFLSPPSNFVPGTIFEIEAGSGLKKLSLELKQAQIIRSRIAFEFFVIIYGGEHHIIASDYFFENKIPVYEVARRISRGDRHLAPIKVTIPEGFNIYDISDAMSLKLPNFNKEKFSTLASGDEGYLFPDTYFFFNRDNENDVIKSMRDNFSKKIAGLSSLVKASGRTEKEIITMASIIEKEAKGDNDRSIISGILWKRLSLNIPLQVDAAPETYKSLGLPKNPIANPGLLAIKAALYPEASPYLYYLHDKGGNVHYAQNFAEHLKNKSKYLK